VVRYKELNLLNDSIVAFYFLIVLLTASDPYTNRIHVECSANIYKIYIIIIILLTYAQDHSLQSFLYACLLCWWLYLKWLKCYFRDEHKDIELFPLLSPCDLKLVLAPALVNYTPVLGNAELKVSSVVYVMFLINK
jgi:hypothetical protein